MIPTLILFGLAFGRWWRTTLAVAAIGWPTWILADGSQAFSWQLVLGAAGFAIANTAVGIVGHQGILKGVRAVRDRDRTPHHA